MNILTKIILLEYGILLSESMILILITHCGYHIIEFYVMLLLDPQTGYGAPEKS